MDRRGVSSGFQPASRAAGGAAGSAGSSAGSAASRPTAGANGAGSAASSERRLSGGAASAASAASRPGSGASSATCAASSASRPGDAPKLNPAPLVDGTNVAACRARFERRKDSDAALVRPFPRAQESAAPKASAAQQGPKSKEN